MFTNTKFGSVRVTIIDGRESYNGLIRKLFEMPPQKEPICFDRDAYNVIKEYHDHMQLKMKKGGAFEFLPDFGNKQVAKVIRIAALLHLCDYSGADCISADCASNAVEIGKWLEIQAMKALESDMISDTEKNARYVAKKLQSCDSKEELSKTQLSKKCKKLSCKMRWFILMICTS